MIKGLDRFMAIARITVTLETFLRFSFLTLQILVPRLSSISTSVPTGGSQATAGDEAASRPYLCPAASLYCTFRQSLKGVRTTFALFKIACGGSARLICYHETGVLGSFLRRWRRSPAELVRRRGSKVNIPPDRSSPSCQLPTGW